MVCRVYLIYSWSVAADNRLETDFHMKVELAVMVNAAVLFVAGRTHEDVGGTWDSTIGSKVLYISELFKRY